VQGRGFKKTETGTFREKLKKKLHKKKKKIQAKESGEKGDSAKRRGQILHKNAQRKKGGGPDGDL